MKKSIIGYSIALASLLAMTGCGSSSDKVATGTLNLSITDGAIDSAEHVYVTFSGVEVGSEQFDFDEPKTIDLLDLQGVKSAPLLEGVELEAGSYQGMRLKVLTEGDPGSYIVLDDGSEHELTIPSGKTSGLKLNRNFDISANGTVDFTIDFDLRKSIVVTKATPGKSESYKLRPTLRITDNSQIGHVTGSVAGDLLTSACDQNDSYAVYIFNGHDADPEDENSTSVSASSPIASSLLNNDEADFRYEIGFIDAGNYTLALTCTADLDDPDVDDAIDFVQQGNVTIIESKEPTTFDFFLPQVR
jgi:hypothetical protein